MNSILNLVFDKWDGDSPINNLAHVNEKLGYNGIMMDLYFFGIDDNLYKKTLL